MISIDWRFHSITEVKQHSGPDGRLLGCSAAGMGSNLDSALWRVDSFFTLTLNRLSSIRPRQMFQLCGQQEPPYDENCGL